MLLCNCFEVYNVFYSTYVLTVKGTSHIYIGDKDDDTHKISTVLWRCRQMCLNRKIKISVASLVQCWTDDQQVMSSTFTQYAQSVAQCFLHVGCQSCNLTSSRKKNSQKVNLVIKCLAKEKKTVCNIITKQRLRLYHNQSEKLKQKSKTSEIYDWIRHTHLANFNHKWWKILKLATLVKLCKNCKQSSHKKTVNCASAWNSLCSHIFVPIFTVINIFPYVICCI